MTKATTAGFAGDATRLIRERITGAAWGAFAALSILSVMVGLKRKGDDTTNITVALIAIVLWLASLWLTAVAIRFMAARPGSRWAIDGPFLRFLGSQMLVTLFAALFFVALHRMMPAATAQTLFAVNFAAQIAVSLLVLPFAPWFAALAVGDDSTELNASIAALGGNVLPLAGATLLLVLPVQLLHSVVARIAMASPSTGLRIGLSLIDGLISALLLALPAAIFVAAWRFVKGEAEHVAPADDSL